MTKSVMGSKQLIVLGNGFDLKCGLKSSYKDFFEQHFVKIFFKTTSVKQRIDIVKRMSRGDKCDQFREQVRNAFSEEESDSFLKLLSEPRSTEKNICVEELMSTVYEQIRKQIYSEIKTVQKNRNLFTDSIKDIDYFFKITFLKENFNRWDIFFLFAECCLSKQVGKYQWQDVETLIYEIVSIVLLPKDMLGQLDSKVEYNKNEVIIGTEEYDARGLFDEIVHMISYTADGSQKEVAFKLLGELKEFEAMFAQFINDQFAFQQGDSYFDEAYELIQKLTRCESNAEATSSFKVLSFNYSIDRRFIDFWKGQQETISPHHLLPKIEDWANIHGIASYATPWQSAFPVQDDYKHDEKYLPAPIFGIDSQEIIKDALTDDLRILFTKPYRILGNEVNRIRESGNYRDVNKISIYGHSLGRADYSYFETLFDEVNLYDSNVTVEYFYYQGNSDVDCLLNKRAAITKIFNLLTDYGKSIGESHGENIVAKLDLEKRLSVVPMDYL